MSVGGAKLMIAEHVTCHVNKHSPFSRKENMLSVLTGLGKGYCCILLPQVRPEGKVLLSQNCVLRTHDEDCKCVSGMTS